jgi:hypothetical protein
MHMKHCWSIFICTPKIGILKKMMTFERKIIGKDIINQKEEQWRQDYSSNFKSISINFNSNLTEFWAIRSQTEYPICDFQKFEADYNQYWFSSTQVKSFSFNLISKRMSRPLKTYNLLLLKERIKKDRLNNV